MCSFFGLGMENYQGDLTDIFRASGGTVSCGTGSPDVPITSWQFPSDSITFSSSTAMIDNDRDNNVFGDPFSNLRDPLLHELNIAGSGYFTSQNSTDLISATSHVDDTGSFSSGVGGVLGQKMCVEDDHMKSPCNIFPRIQISQTPKLQSIVSPRDSPVMPAASPRGIKAPVMLPSDMINNVHSSKSCLLDNAAPVQIPSPRNLGIKRRKNQAKKVVCIPAPAASNSRSSGEVVPSDLWAWRKYGQKPIKGSPYPRGYYRCSSSKGCSARKQVERSRTDPNMLVITYTSEHNHPWPTQRNALAGSTRSQPSKTNPLATSSKSSPSSHTQSIKEEVKESSNETMSPPIVAASSSASVKEEIEKQLKMDDAEFSEEYSHSYRPALPDSNQSEDFFADLDEIQGDPLSLLFTQGFSSGDENREIKTMDPFNLFDWSGDNNNNIITATKNKTFGEAK
ncbi:WRKY domain-containing protein [Cephalotus follicularis]|uniref:WRKY domain-containing protein n=1 Tax=Cephalotus follicularis TaxID=3775 RepID=A0A1Q3BCG3_CEPFO|nr:WRKY domain-containing protein [Cephalotus follicularis]